METTNQSNDEDNEDGFEGFQQRGVTKVGTMIVNQNFMLVEGCKPSHGVNWDTQMIKDIVDMFEKHYDKEL